MNSQNETVVILSDDEEDASIFPTSPDTSTSRVRRRPSRFRSVLDRDDGTPIFTPDPTAASDDIDDELLHNPVITVTKVAEGATAVSRTVHPPPTPQPFGPSRKSSGLHISVTSTGPVKATSARTRPNTDK